MVATPLHYPVAYILNRAGRGRLSLTGLVVGSFLPDIEVPVLLLIGFEYPHDRLVLHSIVGCLLFSWIIAAIALPFYGLFVEKLLNVKFEEKLTLNFLVSAEIGALFHVFVDLFHHAYNPLLWPFSSESVDTLVLFGNWRLASIVMHVIFGTLLLVIVLIELRNIKRLEEKSGVDLLRKLLIRLLVERVDVK